MAHLFSNAPTFFEMCDRRSIFALWLVEHGFSIEARGWLQARGGAEEKRQDENQLTISRKSLSENTYPRSSVLWDGSWGDVGPGAPPSKTCGLVQDVLRTVERVLVLVGDIDAKGAGESGSTLAAFRPDAVTPALLDCKMTGPTRDHPGTCPLPRLYKVWNVPSLAAPTPIIGLVSACLAGKDSRLVQTADLRRQIARTSPWVMHGKSAGSSIFRSPRARITDEIEKELTRTGAILKEGPRH